jgi:hypothetical protein
MRHTDQSNEPCAFYRLSLSPSRSSRSALGPCFRRLLLDAVVSASINTVQKIAKLTVKMLTVRRNNGLPNVRCRDVDFRAIVFCLLSLSDKSNARRRTDPKFMKFLVARRLNRILSLFSKNNSSRERASPLPTLKKTTRQSSSRRRICWSTKSLLSSLLNLSCIGS